MNVNEVQPEKCPFFPCNHENYHMSLNSKASLYIHNMA